MLINQDELKRGIGFIITKGDPDRTGIDYIEELDDLDEIIDSKKDDSKEDDKKQDIKKLKDWLNFFHENSNRVFYFPRPLKLT